MPAESTLHGDLGNKKRVGHAGGVANPTQQSQAAGMEAQGKQSRLGDLFERLRTVDAHKMDAPQQHEQYAAEAK